jgi:polyisoprenoid-binding protein YceI
MARYPEWAGQIRIADRRMWQMLSFTSSVALALWTVIATATVAGQTRPIDAERSTLTVFVYKSGFFSAFADDHVIRAPIASGSVSAEAPLRVAISVRSANLKVLDPGLSTGKRAEVQARMLGPEVLDSAKYPDIVFTSTEIKSTGADRWAVTGRLTLHGVTREITFSVTQKDGRYRGTTVLKQRDFGIEPISIVGGTVKVKDELKVEFDIVMQAST